MKNTPYHLMSSAERLTQRIAQNKQIDAKVCAHEQLMQPIREQAFNRNLIRVTNAFVKSLPVDMRLDVVKIISKVR